MKLKKITVLLALSGIYTCSIAQSTVYKCENTQGIVSYLNEPQSGYSCQKTDLGSIKNMATIKNEGGFKSGSNSSAEQIKNFNEKITKPTIPNEAELRRLSILKKELDDEKKQLDTTKNMIANIADKNSQDAIRIKEIASSHQRNIDSLEGQIAKINPQDIKTLPLNIPVAEMNRAILEGKKLGNINNLPTNKLVIDREAVIPVSTVMPVMLQAKEVKDREQKIDIKQIESSRSAEEAVRLSSLALEEAKKKLEEIEKKAIEAKELYQKEKFEKDFKIAKENLNKQEESNQRLKKDVFKIEDELLVIMKRQNLLLEERNFLWRRQQQLEEQAEIKRGEREKIAAEDKLKQIEVEKKKIVIDKMKKDREILLAKNKELSEQKIKTLLESKKIIEIQNIEMKNKQVEIDKSLRVIQGIL